jgi:hypothetical protein
MADIHYKESGKRMARNEAIVSGQNEDGVAVKMIVS